MLAAQADLVIDALVGLQVVAGQLDHLAAHQQIQVHLDRAQGQTFRGTEQAIGAGVDHGFGALHLIGRVEAIKQHLPQAQLGGAVVQCFSIVIADGSGAWAVGMFTAIAHQQVDGWQVATFSNLDLFIR